MRSLLGADQNMPTYYLFVIPSPNKCGRRDNSTRDTYSVQCCGMMYTIHRGRSSIVTPSTQLLLPLPHRALLVYSIPPRKSLSEIYAFKLTILYFQYSCLPLVNINNTDARRLLLFTFAPNESTQCASPWVLVYVLCSLPF